MTDIVASLRAEADSHPGTVSLDAEAADEIERLRVLNTKLARFAEWVVSEGSWSGCDLDGGTIQDQAVDLGILVETKYDPKAHGESEFDAEPGDPWFVLSDEVQAALKRQPVRSL